MTIIEPDETKEKFVPSLPFGGGAGTFAGNAYGLCRTRQPRAKRHTGAKRSAGAKRRYIMGNKKITPPNSQTRRIARFSGCDHRSYLPTKRRDLTY